MIDQKIFNAIVQLTRKDSQIELALMEELGEYIRAMRIEDGLTLNKSKTCTESSKVEIVDLMLCAIEAFISRGGTYDELVTISVRKLNKWSTIVNAEAIS